MLAITPPDLCRVGFDAGLIAAWHDAGLVDARMRVLLRMPGSHLAGLVAALADRRSAMLRLAVACADAGIAVSLSVAPLHLKALRELWPKLPGACRNSRAGLQLKGDPDRRICNAARRLFPRVCLGASMHTEPALPLRSGTELDYLCVAPVFDPSTAQIGRDKRGVGVGLVRAWAGVGVPVLALGGVTAPRVAPCRAAGAFGIAGIGAFFGDVSRVADNARQICAALQAGGN